MVTHLSYWSHTLLSGHTRHRALCSLFQQDTESTRVSKCRQLPTQMFVYTHPSPSIIYSPADQVTFSRNAGQSQVYYNTLKLRVGDINYDLRYLETLTCGVAVPNVLQCSHKPIPLVLFIWLSLTYPKDNAPIQQVACMAVYLSNNPIEVARVWRASGARTSIISDARNVTTRAPVVLTHRRQ